MRMRTWGIYRVKKPCTPGFEGTWCVAWKSNVMPGPAFWYYRTRKLARAARDALHDPHRVHRAFIEDTTPMGYAEP